MHSNHDHHGLTTSLSKFSVAGRQSMSEYSSSYRSAGYSNLTDGSYILSPICGGCFRSKSGNKHCSKLIFDRQMKDGIPISDAANTVGRENVDCNICDVDYCLRSHFNGRTRPDESIDAQRYQTKYWRFDRSGPRIAKATTLALTSIPSEFRIPPSRFDDVDVYFEVKYNATKTMDFYLEVRMGWPIIFDLCCLL